MLAGAWVVGGGCAVGAGGGDDWTGRGVVDRGWVDGGGWVVRGIWVVGGLVGADGAVVDVVVDGEGFLGTAWVAVTAALPQAVATRATAPKVETALSSKRPIQWPVLRLRSAAMGLGRPGVHSAS